MRKGKNKISKKANFTFLVFFTFLILAFIVLLLLEYHDFRKGEDSFIFTKIIGKNRLTGDADKFNVKLLNYLNKKNISYDYFRDTEKRYHFKIDIERSEYGNVKGIFEKYSKGFGFRLIQVETKRYKRRTFFLYKTLFGDKTVHLLLVNRLESSALRRRDKKKVIKKISEPKIAFIIDDIGNYNIGAYELKKLGIPVTASVLPDSPHGFKEAEWIGKYNLKALIHLPMQPKKDLYNHVENGRVISLTSTDKEIEDLIRRAKTIVPNAEGLNNHQGSLITSDAAVMRRVLKIIKSEGLFFVDSRTDFDTKGFKLAKQLNIKTAERDVFLDHTRTYKHSMFQIKRLVQIAKKDGKAIAIGHPFESTFQAIKDSLNFIRSEGIRIVFVRELLE